MAYMEKEEWQSNEKICELLVKERQCRVSQRPHELGGCYYPDATVTTSWTAGSVNVKDYLFGGKAPVHDPEFPIVSRVGYPVVHRNGNRAYAEVPQNTYRWVSVNGEKAVLTIYMRLIYRVERRESTWKISDFSSIYEGDTLEAEIPGTNLHIDPAEVMKYRRSLRYMSYVDGNVPQTLPGADQPAVVMSIYAELDEWLNQ